MVKFSLDIEYDYSFILYGISCHEKDYRLCWAINNKLKTNLKKGHELEIKERKQTENSHFSVYTYNKEEQYCEYYLISNRFEQSILIPEQKQADYFLKVVGHISVEEKQALLMLLRDINIILTAYEIDPNQLKSKQNLLF